MTRPLLPAAPCAAIADPDPTCPDGPGSSGLSAFERALMLMTQDGLPLVPRPYADIARRLGVAETDVLHGMKRLAARGVMRRIGLATNHYSLGYTANGMSVWDVDDSLVESMGLKVGALEGVTHCYQRPRALPDWPYNLFAMVHGHSREDVRRQVEVIAEVLRGACRSHDLLFSSRILKKTGMRLHGG